MPLFEKIRVLPKWKLLLISTFILVGTPILTLLIWSFMQSQRTDNSHKQNESSNSPITPTVDSTEVKESDADKAGKRISGSHCTGTEKQKLTHLPMNSEDVAFILPYGLMVGGHVTPVDHQYFSPIIFDSPTGAYNVYAMADSKLVGLTTRTHQGQGQNRNLTVTDYRLVFSLSCRLFYYYDLVNSLAPGLEEQFNLNRDGVPVTAGQLIGKIGGQTLDFAVWDTDRPLSGFIVPEHYDFENWKIYTVDPLEYYTDEIKGKILEKYVRTAEPISGKIDFDVDGKLIGNWFQVGTNGYGGVLGHGQTGYWVGHLAIAPYFLDPNNFLISIGNWPGDASQFAVKENGPDPLTVGQENGLIKYNLVRFYNIKANGQRWDNITYTKSVTMGKENFIEGCMLLQMTGPRALTGEAFKGKSCDQVSGFTANATKYER